MRCITLAVFAFIAAVGIARPATAASVYLGLGDSITFGETDLRYIPSLGDRGYVGLYADTLAARNGGVRPNVINLAIDGETTSSFMTGVGRTTPVIGRTDPVLAAQNLNYSSNPLTPQITLLQSTVATQQAAGNTINTVSITQGFNDLAALASLPPSTALAQIGPTLATVRANYSDILTEVRRLLPNANLFVLNYFNPFPADPGNPAGPIFAAGGPELNNIIRDLAAQYGGSYVDTFTPFVGREAALTFIDEMPHGSTVPPPSGGVLPVGNVHPNAAGYQMIASQVAAASAVPEPSSVVLLATGGALALRVIYRRRGRTIA